MRALDNLVARQLESLLTAPEELKYSFNLGAGQTESLTAREMRRRICGFAHSLRQAGLRQRTVTPILASSSAALWAAFAGAMATDLIPCILSAPTFKSHLPTYVRNLKTLLDRYQSNTLIAAREYHARLLPILQDLSAEIRLLELEALDAPRDSIDWELAPGGANVAFLQHSSGSTGTPKGVALSHSAVLAHLSGYADFIHLNPRVDRICSWLPLYHDMGLLTSFLLPLTLGVSCHTVPPQEWIVDPLRILSLITRDRSTLAWWPNFTYSLLATRVRPEEIAGFDLSSLRMLVNCSEPVMAASHEKFAKAFSLCGLKPGVLQCSYAMAENVFAVTQSSSEGPAQLHANKQMLAFGENLELVSQHQPHARTLMSSGPVMPSVGLKIVDDQRQERPAGFIGEIAISGESLFNEYHCLPEITSPVRVDGWYFTNDVGFIHRGELFVLGRKSDLIIVGGRKYYPNDIEHIVNGIQGVKEGRVVAFGIVSEERGTEEVVVLAESVEHQDRTKVQAMKKEIKARVLHELDCAVDHTRILAPQSLIKTSSGKIARKDNRTWFQDQQQARSAAEA